MPLFDADDLHPKSNIEKMSRGEPLTDADREPWLNLVRATAEHACAEQQLKQLRTSRELCGVVVACSALKKYYRDIIRGAYKPDTVASHLEPPVAHALPTYIVFLSGSREILMERMNSRQGHFMKAALLDSQLKTLEIPESEEDVITVNVETSTDSQVRYVKQKLHDIRVSGI